MTWCGDETLFSASMPEQHSTGCDGRSTPGWQRAGPMLEPVGPGLFGDDERELGAKECGQTEGLNLDPPLRA
jgi:hypothetical protein